MYCMETGGINTNDPTGIIASASASYNAKNRISKKVESKKYEYAVHSITKDRESGDKPYETRLSTPIHYTRKGEEVTETFEEVLGGIINELA
jgi:hypothetical protein